MKACIQVVLIISSMAHVGLADVLKLKNGTVLHGKYVEGTGDGIRFKTEEGIQTFKTSSVADLKFTSDNEVTEPAGAAKSSSQENQSKTQASSSTVTIPAGTMLLVRLTDNVSSEDASGRTFSSRLEYDLDIGGTTALKAGTPIYGTLSSAQAGRIRGKSALDLRLTKIVAEGQQIPISTLGHHEASEASIRKAAKGAAGGAIIGGIAGDAGKGAAIGGTVGALVRPKSVSVASGTLLEFELTEPVSVRPQK